MPRKRESNTSSLKWNWSSRQSQSTIDGSNFTRILEEGQREVEERLPLVEEFGIEMEPFGQKYIPNSIASSVD